MIIEALKAVLFGIVEGITEWLPVSSTGHMMLLNEFVKMDVSPAFYGTFLVVIQLGAILAVIMLFFNKLNPFARSKTPEQKKETWGIWAKVVVGSIPAAIVGFALDDWMEENLMNGEYGAIVVACCLVIYGIIFIVMERRNKKRIMYAQACKQYHESASSAAGSQALQASAANAISQAEQGENAEDDAHARVAARLAARRAAQNGKQANQKSQSKKSLALQAGDDEEDASSIISKVNSFSELSFGRAFAIGAFQALAIIPGTSRSGSIIIGSMLLGASRTIATEFAFFLAIPIMFGWSILKLLKHGFAYTSVEWVIFFVGISVSFIVSVLAIKFLLGYIKKNDFTVFGVYRIILGLVLLVFFGSQILL